MRFDKILFTALLYHLILLLPRNFHHNDTKVITISQLGQEFPTNLQFGFALFILGFKSLIS